MRASKYVVTVTEKSTCPMCGQKLDMLAPENMAENKPWFFICWLCKNVVQVGIGPVVREE